MMTYEAEKEKFKKMSFEEFKIYVAKEEERGFLHTFYKNGTNLTFFIDDLDKMQYLVDVKNVEFKILSENYTTPIFFKNPEVTEYLFNKGLSIDASNQDGMTILLGASYETTKKLIELGVDFEPDDISILPFIDRPYDKAELLLKNGFLNDMMEIDPRIYMRDHELLSLLIKYNMEIREYQIKGVLTA